ncbi:MAG: hypothetical protein ACJ74Y_15635 [Bryobacteraceae bacterium]
MTTRTYGPVSRQQAEQFLTQAQNNGLTVNRETNSNGTVAGYGNEVRYSYDDTKQQIALTLQRHLPFLEGAVWTQVEERLPPGVSRI